MKLGRSPYKKLPGGGAPQAASRFLRTYLFLYLLKKQQLNLKTGSRGCPFTENPIPYFFYAMLRVNNIFKLEKISYLPGGFHN